MTAGLSHPYRLDRLDEAGSVLVQTDEAERIAVAHRMGIPAIRVLTCRFDLRRGEPDVILAEGRLQAEVSQVCVVTLEPFDATIDETFQLRFVPEGTEREEFDLAAADEIPYRGDVIDLGEATAEELALALDPFPRKPEAVMPAGAAPGAAGPFEALSQFRGLARPDRDC